MQNHGVGYTVTKFEQVVCTTQNTLKYLATYSAIFPFGQNIWDT